jgi:Amino acid permeases
MLRSSLLRVDSYNYRAGTNLSRTVTHESGTSIVKSKTWSQRTFGEIKEGSMRVAIFTLIATSMETGCLSLPVVLKYVGLIPGIIIILLAAYASNIGMNGISLAANKANIFDYSKLVKKVLGNVIKT